jgi:hypothetical protein
VFAYIVHSNNIRVTALIGGYGGDDLVLSMAVHAIMDAISALSTTSVAPTQLKSLRLIPKRVPSIRS